MGVRMILGITVRIQIGTGVRLTSEYAVCPEGGLRGVCVHVWPTIWALIGPFQYIMDTYGQLYPSRGTTFRTLILSILLIHV